MLPPQDLLRRISQALFTRPESLAAASAILLGRLADRGNFNHVNRALAVLDHVCRQNPPTSKIQALLCSDIHAAIVRGDLAHLPQYQRATREETKLSETWNRLRQFVQWSLSIQGVQISAEAIRPQLWTCAACTFDNQPEAEKCSICQAPRPEPQNQPKPTPTQPQPQPQPQPVLSSQSVLDGIPRHPKSSPGLPNGWQESTHGDRRYFQNHFTKSTQWEPPSAAQVAQADNLAERYWLAHPEERPPTGLSQQPLPSFQHAEVKPQPVAQKKEESMWTCPACTLRNAMDRSECDICGASKPALPAASLAEAPKSEEPSAVIPDILPVFDSSRPPLEAADKSLFPDLPGGQLGPLGSPRASPQQSSGGDGIPDFLTDSPVNQTPMSPPLKVAIPEPSPAASAAIPEMAAPTAEGGAAAGGAVSAETAAPRPNSGSLQLNPEVEWECSRCGWAYNVGGSMGCEVCMKPRVEVDTAFSRSSAAAVSEEKAAPASGASASPESAVPGQSEPVETENDAVTSLDEDKKNDAPWTCNYCTFTNDPGRATCEVCETHSSVALAEVGSLPPELSAEGFHDTDFEDDQSSSHGDDDASADSSAETPGDGRPEMCSKCEFPLKFAKDPNADICEICNNPIPKTTPEAPVASPVQLPKSHSSHIVGLGRTHSISPSPDAGNPSIPPPQGRIPESGSFSTTSSPVSSPTLDLGSSGPSPRPQPNPPLPGRTLPKHRTLNSLALPPPKAVLSPQRRHSVAPQSRQTSQPEPEISEKVVDAQATRSSESQTSRPVDTPKLLSPIAPARSRRSRRHNRSPSSAPEIWNCGLCSTPVPSVQDACHMCGSDRPQTPSSASETPPKSAVSASPTESGSVPPQSPSHSSPLGSPVSGSQDPEARKKWACSYCQRLNPIQESRCEVCGRGQGRSFVGNQTRFQESGAEEWQCPDCDYSNPLQETSCLACSQPQPGTESPAAAEEAEGAQDANKEPGAEEGSPVSGPVGDPISVRPPPRRPVGSATLPPPRRPPRRSSVSPSSSAAPPRRPSMGEGGRPRRPPRRASYSIGSTPAPSPEEPPAEEPEEMEEDEPEDKRSERLDQKLKIRAEIIASEKIYVFNLTDLMNRWVNPILAKAEAYGITHQQAMDMFGNLPSLARFHQVFLSKLEHSHNVSSVFIKFGNFLKMYTAFVNGYEKTCATLNAMRRNKKFQRFLNKTQESVPNGGSLLSFLITPVQRIPRYVLLLDRLKSKSKPWEEDWEDLSAALDKVREIADHINNTKRQAENMTRLLDIQNMLRTDKFTVMIPHRRLIREGRAVCIRTGTKVSEEQLGQSKFQFRICVFNDKILFMTQSHKFSGVYDIPNLEIVTDLPEGTLPAQDRAVVVRDRSLKKKELFSWALILETQLVKDAWAKDLEEAIASVVSN